MGTSSDAAQSKSHGFRRVGGKKTPGDTAVNDAFPSAFASVSAHLLEGATDSVLTGSTDAGHSGDDEAAERSAEARKRIPIDGDTDVQRKLVAMI
jgi:hypothetical protein